MLKCKIASESASNSTYSLKKSADLVDCVGLVDESNASTLKAYRIFYVGTNYIKSDREDVYFRVLKR